MNATTVLTPALSSAMPHIAADMPLNSTRCEIAQAVKTTAAPAITNVEATAAEWGPRIRCNSGM